MEAKKQGQEQGSLLDFNSDFNVGLFLDIVRKNLIWVFLLVVIFSTIIHLYLRWASPVFEARGSVMLKTEQTSKLLGTDRLLVDEPDEVFRQSQIIQSAYLIRRALKRIPWEVSYFQRGSTRFVFSELYKASPFKVDVFEIINPAVIHRDINVEILSENTFEIFYTTDEGNYREVFRFDKYFETPYLTLRIQADSILYRNFAYYKDQNYFFRLNDLKQYASIVANNLTVTSINPSVNLMQIAYKDFNNVKVSDIVNALCDEFLIYDLERKAESANKILEFLATQIDTFSEQLSQFQDTLKDFRLKNQYLNPEDEFRNIMSKLDELDSRTRDLEMNKDLLGWLNNYIQDQKSLIDVASNIPAENFNSFIEVASKIKQLEEERSQLLMEVTEEHPEIRHLDSKLLLLRYEMYENIQATGQVIDFKKARLRKLYMENLDKILSLPEKEAEFARLHRQYTIKENFYMNLLDKQAEFSIAQAGIVSDYIILERSSAPYHPIAPNKPLYRLLGIAMGLLIGILLIVIRYLLHNTIISIEDVTRSTTASLLGIVPSYSKNLEGSKVIVNKSPKSVISESFRSIRANMQFLAHGEAPRVVVVTSTVSGEGKTFIALNLAAALSLLSKKVLIIDLDLRKPKIDKAFEVESRKGMSNILSSQVDWKDFIYQSEIPGLDFITSGPTPPNPAELLLSPQLDLFLENAKKEYDFVVCDTPPVGIVTDALDLMKKADYPIYVLRADYSKKAFIANVNRLKEQNGIKGLSVVLNDLGRGASAYGYGYNYGYGRSYGYGYGYGYTGGYYVEEEKEKKGLWQILFGQKRSKSKMRS